MKKPHVGVVAAVALALSVMAGIAPAQETEGAEPDLVPDSAEGLAEGTQPGWTPFLNFSGNFALGHNKDVPGSPDGASLNFGYLINGSLGYLNDTKEHEWINTLLWSTP
jgi:hypothetical protein